jgi:hypothetical protein
MRASRTASPVGRRHASSRIAASCAGVQLRSKRKAGGTDCAGGVVVVQAASASISATAVRARIGHPRRCYERRSRQMSRRSGHPDVTWKWDATARTRLVEPARGHWPRYQSRCRGFDTPLARASSARRTVSSTASVSTPRMRFVAAASPSAIHRRSSNTLVRYTRSAKTDETSENQFT